MKTLMIMGIVVLALGCGDDGAGGDEAGGQTTAQTTTTTEGFPAEIPCGEMTCTDGDVCIIRPQQADCTNKENPDDPCPPDRPNDTVCGGPGGPCCCGPTPPPIYECNPAAQCEGPVSCDCLMDVCAEPDYECTATVEPGQFNCFLVEA